MKNIYFTSCDKAGGIYHYTFDNGQLTFCEKNELDRPMYTVISENMAYVLLRETDTETNYGGLVCFDIAADGRFINQTEAVSTHGAVPCHICVEDGDIYAVNYLSGNVILFPDKIATHSGNGPNPQRQEAPHTHFSAVSLDKKYVLCTDLGIDTVFVYDRKLNFVSSAKVPSGSGCRHLCFNGNTVYCVNELSNDVSVFSFEKGILTLLDTYAAIPDFSGKSTAAAIRIYGGRLYVSHRGADCISCFEIRDKNLKLIWSTPCGGHSPRDFDIVDGYIICANEGGNISVLKINDSGAEIISADIKMPNPLCVTEGETI